MNTALSSSTSVKARIHRTKRGIMLASALTVAAVVSILAAMHGGGSETASITSNEPAQQSVQQ